MSTIVDTHDEAARLDLPPLLVRRPLEAFLDQHGLGSGPIEAETVGAGHSNVTYLIRRDGGEWVLRRPPRPPLPPSAHDVLREARLLLAVAGQPVRTPQVLATCDDPEVIGAPFYVMERVQGDVITTAIPDALDTPEQRRRVADELIDALVEIHAVPWEECGLEGYGKPTGSLDRQLRRFGGLWSTTRRGRSRCSTGSRRGSASTSPSRRRPRSCTATTGSGTRCSPPARPRGWWRYSTGSWRRSAIPWPTSAT